MVVLVDIEEITKNLGERVQPDSLEEEEVPKQYKPALSSG